MAGDRKLESRAVRQARQLRRDATDAERKLWSLLSHRRIEGAKFRRQHPFGPYILDFYCEAPKLAVEADGGQHTEESDRGRTAYLTARGVALLRFWNSQILQEGKAVAETIAYNLRQRATPSPLPALTGRAPPSPRGEGRQATSRPLPWLPFPARLRPPSDAALPESAP